jgi:hypothetical protein
MWAVGWWHNPSPEVYSLAMRYTGPPCPTNTPTHTRTPAPTATPCPMTFTDVQPTDYFYDAVRYLYCAGVISGYADNTFRPYNNMTRAQLCKVVVLGFSYPPPGPPPTPIFTDVPADHPFYYYIWVAEYNGLVTGYADGTFRPYNNITRGQTAKVVVLAAEWPLLNPAMPTFSDVPTDNAFYTHIETAYCHEIIQGYADGTFRPGNPATRGQIAKVVHEALLNTGSCR